MNRREEQGVVGAFSLFDRRAQFVDDAEREGFNFVSIFNHFSLARFFFRDVA